MGRYDEIKAMAELIIKSHDGQAYFNFGEADKIMGCGRNAVGTVLHESGITVKKIGSAKRVSAFDIATAMYTDRIASIRTD